jgi:hypothetical protein
VDWNLLGDVEVDVLRVADALEEEAEVAAALERAASAASPSRGRAVPISDARGSCIGSPAPAVATSTEARGSAWRFRVRCARGEMRRSSSPSGVVASWTREP